MSEDRFSSEETHAFGVLLSRLQQKLPHAAQEIYLSRGLLVPDQDTPPWWHENNNFILKHPNADFSFPTYIGSNPPKNSIVFVGANCISPNQILILGDNAIVFFGPQCSLPNGTIICGKDAMVVLAGNLFAISAATLDARNGGLIYVGDDNLWSSNIKINTDDMHAMFDQRSFKRINRYGSTVAVGTHVWLGSDVLINPGGSISDNVVIGSRSVVTKAIPTGCVAVGAPARVVRKGITWTREDVAPGSSLPNLTLPAQPRGLSRLMRWLKNARHR